MGLLRTLGPVLSAALGGLLTWVSLYLIQRFALFGNAPTAAQIASTAAGIFAIFDRLLAPSVAAFLESRYVEHRVCRELRHVMATPYSEVSCQRARSVCDSLTSLRRISEYPPLVDAANKAIAAVSALPEGGTLADTDIACPLREFAVFHEVLSHMPAHRRKRSPKTDPNLATN